MAAPGNSKGGKAASAVFGNTAPRPPSRGHFWHQARSIGPVLPCGEAGRRPLGEQMSATEGRTEQGYSSGHAEKPPSPRPKAEASRVPVSEHVGEGSTFVYWA